MMTNVLQYMLNCILQESSIKQPINNLSQNHPVKSYHDISDDVSIINYDTDIFENMMR